jgi:hypothetical protein
MTSGTIEDYDRLARGNEDRFSVIEGKLNRALELLEEGDSGKAADIVTDAAHDAGEGVRQNLVATQRSL